MAKLQKREKVMVGMAVSSLLSFLLYQFAGGGDSAELAQIIVQPVANEASPAQPAVSKGPVEKTIHHALERKPFELKSWKRDPFAEAHRLAPPDSTQEDCAAFALKGIIWRGDQALALIGGNILKEGEYAGDLKVLDIEKDRVVCKRGKKVITLLLDNE